MNKILVLPVLLLNILILQVVTVTVNAVDKDKCHEYYYYYNGGVVPPINPSVPSNCSKLSSTGKVTATKSLTNCTGDNLVKNHIIQYCKYTQENGRYTVHSKSTASGIVYIFSTKPSGTSARYDYNFKNLTTGKEENLTKGPNAELLAPKNTGIKISTGDKYIMRFREDTNGDNTNKYGVGWRKIDFNAKIYDDHKAFVEQVRQYAALNGFTIIAEQYWADTKTNSNYDSYDFEDVPIILAVKEDAPKCEENKVTLGIKSVDDLTTLYLGEKAEYSISIGKPSIYKNPSNVFSVEGSQSSAFANGLVNNSNQKCDLKLGKQTCMVTNRVVYNKNTYNTNVKWTHNYQVCNGSSCNSCSESKEFIVYPYPGFLKTINNGSTYVGNIVNIKRFPDGQFFTDRLLLTKSDTFNSFQPPLEKILQPDTSNVKTLATKYTDANNRENFFSWYKSKLLVEPKFGDIVEKESLTINNEFFATLKQQSTEVDLVHIKGDAIINDAQIVNCIKSTIFIVDGNLTFQQEFKIPSNQDTACFFLVGNNTTVAHNVSNIDAFIVTMSAKTEVEGKLILKGGLIIQGYNNTSTSMLRNINATVVAASSIKKDDPSELLQYDGARYVRIFNDYLKEPFQLSIREIQYTNN